MAEPTPINSEGFSNYTEIIQHLQTSINPNLCPLFILFLFCSVWNHHNNIPENSRRMATDDPIPSSSSHSKSSSHYHHSQQGHYSHHQNWSNYNNPRRSGGNPNYSRGYNDGYWNGKGSRFASHRSVNSLMNNSNNYQQQSSQPSPPTQRRPNDLQQQYDNQTYYKSTHCSRSKLIRIFVSEDRRANGYHSQHSTDSTSEQSTVSSTQSFPNHLNTFNR